MPFKKFPAFRLALREGGRAVWPWGQTPRCPGPAESQRSAPGSDPSPRFARRDQSAISAQIFSDLLAQPGTDGQIEQGYASRGETAEGPERHVRRRGARRRPHAGHDPARCTSRYGFEPLETPAFEYTDALGKFLPDQDRPNEGVFSFQDEDEQWLSLRYDLTAPLARYVAENYDRLPKPFRRYAVGPVWRNEKPGPGRFRQFTQFDADTVGTDNIAADAEICMLAADTMEALGIKRGDYVIKVNNRKVLDGVMELIGLGGEENAGRRLVVLRAIDKLDRLRIEGVRQLLGSGRKDESGDFTKGAGLDEQQTRRILSLFGFRERSEQIAEGNPPFQRLKSEQRNAS